MATVTTIFEEGLPRTAGAASPQQSISWPAVFAGAVAAAALSLILLVLGMGLGLSALSPWAQSSAYTEKITWGTIVWTALTAAAASAFGGYIAGRLRDRWRDVQVDEVYFRDTVHGFLTWAVATLGTAAVLASVIGVVVGAAEPSTMATSAPAVDAANAALMEQARGNAARTSLWVFVTLLLGAFAASWMATIGGRQRDLP